jgi:hypothetical protein
MPTKVQFIREVHDKIQINKRKKKHWKGVRKITRYKKDKNIERVQDNRQETNFKWNLIDHEL